MLEIIRSTEFENIDAGALICHIERGHEYFLGPLTDKSYDYGTKVPVEIYVCMCSTGG